MKNVQNFFISRTAKLKLEVKKRSYLTILYIKRHRKNAFSLLTYLVVNFRYSEKATQIWPIFHFFWHCKIKSRRWTKFLRLTQNIWTLKAKMFSHQDPDIKQSETNDNPFQDPDIKQSATNDNPFQANQSNPKIGCNSAYLKSCPGFLKIFAMVRHIMIHSS